MPPKQPEFATKEDKSPQENTCYDMVFIVGPDHTTAQIAAIEKKAQESGLKICIIGDGVNLIDEEELKQKLKNQIGPKTKINISAHGSVTSNEHRITLLRPSQLSQRTKTAETLEILKHIYDEDPRNTGTKMSVDIYSCYCGQIKNEVLPDLKNLQVTLHSGKKYRSLEVTNFEMILTTLEGHKDIFEQFVDWMLWPETAVITVRDAENRTHNFKKLTPKQPILLVDEFKRYLDAEIRRLLDFRINTLHHSAESVLGVDKLPYNPVERKMAIYTLIPERSKAIIEKLDLTQEKLLKYNWLALITECRHNNTNYVASLPDTRETATYINAEFINGLIALHIAVERGYIKLIEKLIEKGANPNKKAKDGSTALLLAANGGHTKAIWALSGRVDVDTTNNKGYAAIHLAAQSGREHALLALLLIGANPNLKTENEHKNTPLHIAVRFSNMVAITMLLDMGAKRNEVDAYGYTPMHLAADSGNAHALKILVENATNLKADLNKPDNNGYTAMHLAQNGHIDAVNTLIENGADPNLLGENGDTPLDLAEEYGHTEVVKLLLAAKEKNEEKGKSENKAETPVNEEQKEPGWRANSTPEPISAIKEQPGRKTTLKPRGSFSEEVKEKRDTSLPQKS